MKKNTIFPSLNNNKAFTLVEIMMAVVVFSIIGAIIAGSYISGTRIRTEQEGVVEINQNIRLAFYMLSRDLRMAGFEIDPFWDSSILRSLNRINGNAQAVGLAYVADDSEKDVNLDGVLDNDVTANLSYYVLGGDLIRNFGTSDPLTTPSPATETPVAANISDITFSYLNDDGTGKRVWGNAPSTPGNTFAVGITIVAESPNIDRKMAAAVQQFTDPYTGAIYTAPADQRKRRMASTVVYLYNMNT